jgi:hypothetical protein
MPTCGVRSGLLGLPAEQAPVLVHAAVLVHVAVRRMAAGDAAPSVATRRLIATRWVGAAMPLLATPLRLTPRTPWQVGS